MDRQPKIIFWETTRKCNLSCAYCRMFGSSAGVELTNKESVTLIGDIAREFAKALLVFSGGEPLLRRDIFNLLSLARSAGLRTALATNGTLLGREEAALLKASRVSRVSISLDSVSEMAHDASRGVKGSFRASAASASILKEHGVAFQINFTVTGKNADEVRPIAEYALSLGAAAVHYFVLVPVGCGRELSEEEMLCADGIEKVLKEISVAARELPMEIRPTCAPQYMKIISDSRAGGCLAGTGAFFISAEGDVYPCGYLPVKAGSVRESSIVDIWRDAETFKRLRSNNFYGSCAKCDLKEACRGCRARAYSVTGDFMSSDPSCEYSKIAC